MIPDTVKSELRGIFDICSSELLQLRLDAANQQGIDRDWRSPEFLDGEVVEFFAKRAEAKGVELSELLNDVLKQDIALLEKMQ